MTTTLLTTSGRPTLVAPFTSPAHPWCAVGRVLLFFNLLIGPLIFYRGTLEPFEFNKVTVLQLTALALAALAAPALVSAWLRGEALSTVRQFLACPLTASAGLFGASAVLSSLTSVSPWTSLLGTHGSMAGLTTILPLLILFLASRALLAGADSVEFLLGALAPASALTAGYALLQVARLDPFVWDDVSPFGTWVRPFGPFGHPNHLAGYLVAAAPLILLRAERAWSRGECAGLTGLACVLVLSGAAVVFALSRGAWLAAGAAALVLVLGRAGTVRGRLLSLAGLVAFPGIVLAGLVLTGHAGLVAARLSTLSAVPERWEIWGTAWRLFLRSPVVGHGPDTFQILYGSERSLAYWHLEWGLTPTRAHCDPLHLLATQGAVGGVTLLAGLLSLLWLSGRAARAACPADRPLVIALLASALAFLVQTLVSFSVVGCAALFVTCAAALSRLAWPRVGDDGPALTDRGYRGAVLAWTAAGGAGAILACCVVLPTWRASALVAEARDRPAEAVALCEEAVRLAPGWTEGWIRCGEALRQAALTARTPTRRQQLVARARLALDRARDLAPDNPDHHVNLARLLTFAADEGYVSPDEALATHDEAQRRDPVNTALAAEAAHAAIALGRTAWGKARLEEALRRDPGYSALWAGLGHLAVSEGRLTDAAGLFEKAVQTDGWHGDQEGHWRTAARLVAVLLAVGRTAEALSGAEWVLESRPDLPGPRLVRARALELLGRPGDALAGYRDALRHIPDDPTARAGVTRLAGR